MALKNYGVLIGKVVDHYPQPGGNPHYVIEVAAADSTYRVALNLESTQKGAPQVLQYEIDDTFGAQAGAAANLVASLRGLAQTHLSGVFLLKGVSGNVPTLDYVRGGFTNPATFPALPIGANPEDNTFSDTFKRTAEQAKNTPDTRIAVFGTGYPDQGDRADNGDPLNASFGFEGVDNVHMNQGNYLRIGRIRDTHYYENGPSQDGGVVFLTAEGRLHSSPSSRTKTRSPIATEIRFIRVWRSWIPMCRQRSVKGGSCRHRKRSRPSRIWCLCLRIPGVRS